MFTKQQIREGRHYISRRSGKTLTEILFPKKANLPKIKTTVPFEIIHQVRIIPKGSSYVFEIVHTKRKKNNSLSRDRIISGDFGANNLLAIVNNFGDHPRIVKGGVVKLANYIVEYQVASLTSKRDTLVNRVIELKKQSRQRHNAKILSLEKQIAKLNERIAPAWIKRNNRVHDYFHKASRQLIDYCLQNEVGMVIIGYNKGWKQDLRKDKKLGKKVRKKFAPIPFLKFYYMIKYKGELEGIKVIRVKEYIMKNGFKNGSSQTCSYCGRTRKANRVKRGLYVCDRCGLKINADINSAINHGKWGRHGFFKGYYMRNFMKPPIPLQTRLATA